MGQMLVRGGDLDGNLGRAAAMIRAAGAAGCQAVVLPECLDVGWTHPAARTLAQPIPGPTSAALCAAARATGIMVAAGLVERDGPRLFNAALLIWAEGEILLKHRKINILEIAQDLYAVGDRLGVAQTAVGTLGLDICADNFPDSLALGHALGRMGARCLLSPSAWAVPADHDQVRDPYGAMWVEAYGQLARLYDMAVVGVSNVGPVEAGPWAGRRCVGCSLAVGPGGAVLARGPYGSEALVPVDIPSAPASARGTGIAVALRARGYTGP
jgi:predicted amidohydrolase